jgi:hypothetical protein
MNRLIIAGLFAIAVLGAATTVLRSHAPAASQAAATPGMASSQQRQNSTAVNNLPIEEFEDMSLVYSTAPKR